MLWRSNWKEYNRTIGIRCYPGIHGPTASRSCFSTSRGSAWRGRTWCCHGRCQTGFRGASGRLVLLRIRRDVGHVTIVRDQVKRCRTIAKDPMSSARQTIGVHLTAEQRTIGLRRPTREIRPSKEPDPTNPVLRRPTTGKQARRTPSLARLLRRCFSRPPAIQRAIGPGFAFHYQLTVKTIHIRAP